VNQKLIHGGEDECVTKGGPGSSVTLRKWLCPLRLSPGVDTGILSSSGSAEEVKGDNVDTMMAQCPHADRAPRKW
jgi:hypothetical protein